MALSKFLGFAKAPPAALALSIFLTIEPPAHVVLDYKSAEFWVFAVGDELKAESCSPCDIKKVAIGELSINVQRLSEREHRIPVIVGNLKNVIRHSGPKFGISGYTKHSQLTPYYKGQFSISIGTDFMSDTVGFKKSCPSAYVMNVKIDMHKSSPVGVSDCLGEIPQLNLKQSKVWPICVLSSPYRIYLRHESPFVGQSASRPRVWRQRPQARFVFG